MLGVATMASCVQSIIELCAYANNKGADQPALKRCSLSKLCDTSTPYIIERRREKTGFLHMRKQRRR